MKIVINVSFGGFALSDEMMEYIGYIKTCEWDTGSDVSRTNPKLIEYLERPDANPNTPGGRLQIVEIPDYVDWVIEDYDGKEWISERHRTWC